MRRAGSFIAGSLQASQHRFIDSITCTRLSAVVTCRALLMSLRRLVPSKRKVTAIIHEDALLVPSKLGYEVFNAGFAC